MSLYQPMMDSVTAQVLKLDRTSNQWLLVAEDSIIVDPDYRELHVGRKFTCSISQGANWTVSNNLLEILWSLADTQYRLSFSAAAFCSTVWDEILSVLLGDIQDTVGRRWWHSRFGVTEHISMHVFLTNIMDSVSPMLANIRNDISYVLDSAQTGTVSSAQWDAYLRWFGPFEPSHRDKSFFKMEQFLTEYRHVVRQAWFHGFISRSLSEQRLMAMPKGAFLLRFASTPQCLALDYKSGPSSFQHVLVTRDRFGTYSMDITGEGIIQFSTLDAVFQQVTALLRTPVFRTESLSDPTSTLSAACDMTHSASIVDQESAAESLVSMVHRDFTMSSPSPTGPTKPASSVVEVDFEDVTITSQKLGEGSFGVVFRGLYQSQVVAVKLLRVQTISGNDMKDFQREIDVMSKCKHENLVGFVGACLTPPHVCVLTEFLAGGSVSGLIVTPDVFARICSDTAMGMAYLHSLNIVHRDLKPDNLLLSGDGATKIADFGLSRTKSMTHRMTCDVGTAEYMAPELVQGLSDGGGQYDEKIDVYAFGIIMWELFTQERPYKHVTSPIAILFKVKVEGARPPVPADCPKHYASLMEECWQQDPLKRPTFAEITDRLRKLYEQ